MARLCFTSTEKSIDTVMPAELADSYLLRQTTCMIQDRTFTLEYFQMDDRWQPENALSSFITRFSSHPFRRD